MRIRRSSETLETTGADVPWLLASRGFHRSGAGESDRFALRRSGLAAITAPDQKRPGAEDRDMADNTAPDGGGGLTALGKLITLVLVVGLIGLGYWVWSRKQ